MTRKNKFDKAIENLVNMCGFDKSESASEAFLEVLGFHVKELQRDVRESHREGLRFDITHALARRLHEERQLRAKAVRK